MKRFVPLVAAALAGLLFALGAQAQPAASKLCRFGAGHVRRQGRRNRPTALARGQALGKAISTGCSSAG